MLPKSANVVIVGGGVLGTSAAFHLAEAGLSRFNDFPRYLIDISLRAVK